MILDDLLKLLERELKLKTPESWDNSGLQIGDIDSDIKKILIILDLDKEAVKFSAENNIDLIITHHPFIFSPIKTIDYSTYDGQLIKDLIINGINVYSMHTSLDMADSGVTRELAEKLDFKDYDILQIINVIDGSGYGGISSVEPINIKTYAGKVKKALNCTSIKLFCNDYNRIIQKVAFCGGSGSDFIEAAVEKGADLYITGDIKYHDAQEALKSNLALIDAGHFYTEYHSLNKILKILKEHALDTVLIDRNTVPELIIN